MVPSNLSRDAAGDASTTAATRAIPAVDTKVQILLGLRLG
jgi:hypothetical protein